MLLDTFDRPPLSPVSRRQAGGVLCRGALFVGIGMMPACSDATPVTVPDGDDTAVLQHLLNADGPRISRRDPPYRIATTLRLRPGSRVLIEPGTRFVWTGPVGSAARILHVFDAAGSDCTIEVENGGSATVEAQVPTNYVYAAGMRGHRGFTVIGLHARECHHVRVDASVGSYAAVRTSGSGANVPRDVLVIGGGASFAKMLGDSHGACALFFVVGGEVRGARYENVRHGVQWWGGNADPDRGDREGVAANERKCRDLVIEQVIVRGVGGGGIWGAMGRGVIVRDCSVEDAQDVAFDNEGGTDILFERCTARNGRNGCFATFFVCDGTRFVDCTGLVDDKTYPLLRIYNSSLSNAENRGLEVVGGRFECSDRSGPATMDTRNGPVQTLSITGAALRNVRIDTAFHNMYRTVVRGNTLTFPYPISEAAAIRVGGSKMLERSATPRPGSTLVESNVIHYTANVRSGTAILVREDDFNGSPGGIIRANHIEGPFATGIRLINASQNAGIRPTFDVLGNRFERFDATGRLLSLERGTPKANVPVIRWDGGQIRNGRSIPLNVAVLGQ